MPAPHWLKTCWQGCRYCGQGLLRLVRWCCWLLLIFTAVGQVVILTSRNLRVPDFVLREIEANLQVAGLQAAFGDVAFDPAGRILLREVNLSIAKIGTPIMRADAIYLEVDPWDLWWREINPRRVQFTGVDFLIPAALSPSGRSQALVEGIDATLNPTTTHGQLVLENFTARIGPIPVTIRGAIQLPPRRSDAMAPWDQIMSEFGAHYLQGCREAGRWLKHLHALPELQLDLELEPDPANLARVSLHARATAMDLADDADPSRRVRLSDARLRTRFSLGAAAQELPVELTARRVEAPFDLILEHVRLRTEVAVAPGGRGVAGGPAELSIDRIVHPAATLSGVTTRTDLRPLPLWQATTTGRLAGEPVAVFTDLDLMTAAGRIDFEGLLGAPVLDIVARQMGIDLPALLHWEQPPHLVAALNLGPRGQPLRLDAKFATGAVEARGVPLSATSARVQWEGTTVRAAPLMLRTGSSQATGSYEMDLANHDFSFLLRGQLDPASINGWFRDWWPRLFAQFDFEAGLPEASVEVSGRWGAPLETRVFVAADATGPIVREIPMNRMRTRLFIRPGWADVLHFLAERPIGTVEGTFLRQWRLPDSRRWTRVAIHAGGVTDLSPTPKLLTRTGDALIAPFSFAEPLEIRLDGTAEREDQGAPVRETFTLTGRASGPWRFKQFPLHGVEFAARREGDRILIDRFTAGLAEGELGGRIELQGSGEDQQIAFDLNLAAASLGETLHDVSTWLDGRRGDANEEHTDFEKQMADGSLSLTLTAAGKSNNLLGLSGSGSAAISNANFSNINLFGVLSALLQRTILNFSTLQLNHANADFTLAGPELVFSQIKATGRRGAVDASGTYSLADRSLSFNTRVRPFEGGEGLLDAVFAPFSTVLEVKLGGELSDPKWTFLYGPTNLLRNLTGENARNRTGTPAAAADAESMVPDAEADPTPPAIREFQSPEKDAETDLE